MQQVKNYPIHYTDIPLMPIGYPISAKIIEDSVSLKGVRLTTFELEYPRYIHAEHLKHRMFSISASSSRAIPTAKLNNVLGTVTDRKIVYPVRWGKNQAGMQPSKENLEGLQLLTAQNLWKSVADACVNASEALAQLGLHKQWANRMLEWFTTIKVVMTATEYDNFFGLRDHHMAQEEIAHLAQAMKKAMNASTPRELKPREWHLPYIPQDMRSELTPLDLCKVSSACCARTSYARHNGGISSIEENLALFERLKSEPPDLPHAVPFEHQATPDDRLFTRFRKDLTANFNGWVQFRKVMEHGLEPKYLKP